MDRRDEKLANTETDSCTKCKRDEKHKRNTRRLYWASVVLGIFILLFWLNFYKYLETFYILEGDDLDYGSGYNILNTLFSGMAFLAFTIALLLQREDIKLQKEELQEGRKVAKEQSETLIRQKFEHTFFKMIDRLKSEFNDARISTNTEVDARISGRMVFIHLHQERPNETTLIKFKDATTVDEKAEGLSSFIEKIRKTYLVPNEAYFRIFKAIYFYLIEHISTENEKRDYLRLLVAQLSIKELYAIKIYCMIADRDLGAYLIKENFFHDLGENKNFFSPEFGKFTTDIMHHAFFFIKNLD